MQGHNLQNLVHEGCPQEEVNDLRFLDRQRKERDLLQELDFHVLDQVAHLGEGNPLRGLGLGLASKSTMASNETLTLDMTSAPDAAAVALSSHSRVPRPSWPPYSTSLICHFVSWGEKNKVF